MTATALPDPPHPDPKPRYRVTVHPYKSGWVINIPELNIITKVQHQHQVEEAARSAVALHSDAPSLDSFTLSITELEE